MKNFYFFGIIAVVFLNGCSPRVTTRDISNFYVNPIGVDDVIVYEIGQSVPDSAEIIGTVSVTDRGFSSDITYDEAVELAKQEVVRLEGTGLVITDHASPSFWTGSMHQLKGQIIYLSDAIIDVEKPNPYLIVAQKIAEETKKGITPTHTFYADIGYGLWMNPLPASIPLFDVQAQAFTLNPGWKNISAASDPFPVSVEWHLGYDWMPSKWSTVGLGAIYTGRFMSYNALPIEIPMLKNYSISYHYIAPQIMLKDKIGTRFMIKCSVGIGYAFFKHTRYDFFETLSLTEHSLGTNILLGVDYLISNNWGIGFNFNCFTVHFSKNSVFGKETVNTLSANIGARYYF